MPIIITIIFIITIIIIIAMLHSIYVVTDGRKHADQTFDKVQLFAKFEDFLSKENGDSNQTILGCRGL